MNIAGENLGAGRTVTAPQFRERMRAIGLAPVGKPSAEAEAFFEQELIRWKRVIDVAGIKLER